MSLWVSDGNETDHLEKTDFITVNEADSGCDMVAATISDQPPEGTLSLVSVLTPDSSQCVGDMDGNILVYIDDSKGITRVRMYRFDRGIDSFIPPVHQDYCQENPAVYDDLVVWEEISPDYMNYSVILHDLGSNESIVISEFSGYTPSTPDIFGHKVVWSESDDIYLYDADSTQISVLTAGTPDSCEYFPVIHGDMVAWQSLNLLDYTSEIRLLALSTGKITSPNPDYYSDTNAAIWGDYLAWSGLDPLNYKTDIYLYHIPTASKVLLTPGTDYSSEDFPAISGGRVVWQGEDSAHQTNAVYMYDIESGLLYRIEPGSPDADQYNPVISGDRVAWHQPDPDHWTYDVWLFTVGETLSPLEADFLVNTTMGDPPLTVQLTDQSTGVVGGWNWDFGDGTGSTDRNPVHTYVDAGTYTVTLTIHNSAQRTGLEKRDLICAGVPPVAMFEADLLEGADPLTVQFTDLSAHDPSYWNWSFGDGESSVVKDPVHVYQQPGIYDVCLAAGNQFGDASHTETGYIWVMEAVVRDMSFTMPGITIVPGEPQTVVVNTTLCTPAGNWNATVLPISFQDSHGADAVIFYSMEGEGFHQDGDCTISGPLRGVQFISSLNDPGPTPDWIVSYRLNQSVYPVDGTVRTEAWENTTPSDYSLFRDAATAPNPEAPQNTYADLEWVAYTVRFSEENLDLPCNATLVLGICSDLVSEFGWGDHGTKEIDSMQGAKIFVDGQFRGFAPLTVHGLAPGVHTATATMSGYAPVEASFTIDDERDSIHVIRIGDDGNGEVLDTRFL